jgi:hypothetical protein
MKRTSRQDARSAKFILANKARAMLKSPTFRIAPDSQKSIALRSWRLGGEKSFFDSSAVEFADAF